MKLIDFHERNVVYAARQVEYLPLPAHRAEDGRITCCWSMSFKERLRVLFTGRIWHQVLTFNQPLQPQLLCIEKPELS